MNLTDSEWTAEQKAQEEALEKANPIIDPEGIFTGKRALKVAQKLEEEAEKQGQVVYVVLMMEGRTWRLRVGDDVAVAKI